LVQAQAAYSHPLRSRNVGSPGRVHHRHPANRRLSSGPGYCGQSGGSAFEVPDRLFTVSRGAVYIRESSFSARICSFNHLLPPEKPTNARSTDAHDEPRLKFFESSPSQRHLGVQHQDDSQQFGAVLFRFWGTAPFFLRILRCTILGAGPPGVSVAWTSGV
jgi:hypothetical protein